MDGNVIDREKSTRKAEAPNATGATRFSMRGMPALSQGATFDPLAAAENLWLSVKVYASGGENALHHHRIEDHAFVIMQGKAIFTFADDSTMEVKQYEGVMIPKGVLYKFHADEAENLVLLRIGGAQRKNPGSGVGELKSTGTPTEITQDTFDADGERKSPTSKMSGSVRKPVVRIPGKFATQP